MCTHFIFNFFFTNIILILNCKLFSVIDCYQSYGGPVKALEPRFRMLSNTLGDSLLHFAIVSYKQE